MVSTWMGDHSTVGHGCCSYKYCKVPKAEKWGFHQMLMGTQKKNQRDLKIKSFFRKFANIFLVLQSQKRKFENNFSIFFLGPKMGNFIFDLFKGKTIPPWHRLQKRFKTNFLLILG